MTGEEKQLVVEETTVVPGKMEFRLISPTESNFLKHIEWNKEELLAAVRSKVALYEGIVYTEETVTGSLHTPRITSSRACENIMIDTARAYAYRPPCERK